MDVNKETGNRETTIGRKNTHYPDVVPVFSDTESQKYFLYEWTGVLRRKREEMIRVTQAAELFALARGGNVSTASK